jgi:large subunit ribosomal protein L4
VQGSGRKLWRQKGTGRARIGSIRSPLWRKGGTVHGPQPRSYAYRLPRKVFLGALRSALSSKLAEEKLTVVDAWQLESHKSKAFREALDKLGSASPTILLVEMAENHNLELASRNLYGVKLSLSHDLQPYDLLRHDRLMISKEAAVRLGAVLGPKDGSAPEQQLVTEIAKAPAHVEKPAAKKAAKPHTEKAAAKPKAAKKPAAAKAKAPKGKGKGKE